MKPVPPAGDTYQVQPDILALPPGLLMLERTGTLIAAGARLTYEEFVAGVLCAIPATRANELVLLGDSVAGEALAALQGAVLVTFVKSGQSLERAGWLLVHDDDARPDDVRRIVGHLRPSLPLARGASIPVFLAHPALIAVPALTPSSPGLNVLSGDCARALHALGMPEESFEVIAATADSVYSVGSLAGLRGTLQTRPPGATRRGGPHSKRSR